MLELNVSQTYLCQESGYEYNSTRATLDEARKYVQHT